MHVRSSTILVEESDWEDTQEAGTNRRKASDDKLVKHESKCSFAMSEVQLCFILDQGQFKVTQLVAM